MRCWCHFFCQLRANPVISAEPRIEITIGQPPACEAEKVCAKASAPVSASPPSVISGGESGVGVVASRARETTYAAAVRIPEEEARRDMGERLIQIRDLIQAALPATIRLASNHHKNCIDVKDLPLEDYAPYVQRMVEELNTRHPGIKVVINAFQTSVAVGSLSISYYCEGDSEYHNFVLSKRSEIIEIDVGDEVPESSVELVSMAPNSVGAESSSRASKLYRRVSFESEPAINTATAGLVAVISFRSRSSPTGRARSQATTASPEPSPPPNLEMARYSLHA